MDLGLYLCSLSTFHLLEYVFALTFHPMDCTSDSFLLFRNMKETAALVASLLEYFLEKWICTLPSVSNKIPRLLVMRGRFSVILSATILVIFFQAIRTIAMWTAGYNFHHNIRDNPDPDQTLITTGLYAWSRHPSYVGWFYWSLSTQILLWNPVCVLLHGILYWHTFSVRIKCEEEALVRDFGRDYWEYRSKVGVGIPFIK